MNERWEIQLLGKLRVRRGDHADLRFPTQRVAALLARLAYRPGENIAREELVDILWPDCLLDKGLPRLSGELTRLRSLLEPPGEVARGAVLRSDNINISLNPAAVKTDIAVFENAFKNGLEATSTAARLPWLVKAVDSYSGPLLLRFEHGWVEPARQGLAERFLLATEQLTAQLAQTGEHERAIAYARRYIAMDARNEDAYGVLLRVLLRAGRVAEMPPVYRELERMLDDKYGSKPAAPARRLMEEATRQSAQKPAIPPPPKAAEPEAENQPAPSQKVALPSGTVTFLATDIQGSTALLHRLGSSAYETVRERHHALLRQEFRLHGGYEFKEVGDGFWVAFTNPALALDCAIACQKALAAEPCPEPAGRVAARMAIHVAAVEAKDGDYRGLGLHETSRQIGAAHGGQILLSEAAMLLLRRERKADIEFKDLGRFQLRDAPTPEHLYQAVYPGMPSEEFAGPNAPHACTPNIPTPMTRFVGREAEQERLAQLLTAPETRLVTVTGMGGTGKTRLVIEVARGLVDHFSGAVWFAALADLADARRIAESILGALRVPPVTGEEAMETAAKALSAQPCLLVLDNFEQLVEDGALPIHDLLERVPTLTCLITSRQLLGISPEREFELLPLPTPKAGAREAEQIGGNVSVQLFVDRAQRRRPDFRLTAGNAAAIAELCERLEGVPLSIELAAAWVKMLAPAQLLMQLKTVLMSNERDLPPRHRSLKAAMDGSYRLLSLELQRIFARLSVFRGGWTVEAATEVCDDPFVLYSLSSLRDASLILAEESDTDGTRYRMLETLREYAEERLCEQKDEEAARRRHHDFFVKMAQTADTELKGENQAEWCRKLDSELGNIQTAMSYSDDHGRLQVASDLYRYWITRGQISAGRERLDSVLSKDVEGIPDTLLMRAVNAAGVLASYAGDFLIARKYLDTSVALCREAGNKRGIAFALVNRANIASQQGEYLSARADYEECLLLWKELGENAPLAITLGNLGALASQQHDYLNAQQYLRDSLIVQQHMNDHFLRANTLQNLGDIERECGEYSASLCHLLECFHIQVQLNDKHAVAMAVMVIARVLSRTESFYESATLLAAADSLFAESQTPLPDSHRHEFNETVAEIRGSLSEEVFGRAWSEGTNLRWEQIIVYVDKAATQPVATLDNSSDAKS